MTTEAPEIRIVDNYRVSCDGGEGAALGHPRVWLQIPLESGWVECPYCDCKAVPGRHRRDICDQPLSVDGRSWGIDTRAGCG